MNDFENLMKKQLGAQYDAFENSRNLIASKGIRINTLKITPADFRMISPFELQQSPYCEFGFLISPEIAPGKHPYHHAGLYYVQEPSAMAVISALQPYIGTKTLDMCAAPGGKTTHVAGLMPKNGLLISNEYVTNRAVILASNVERLGIKNCTVTNNSPEEIASIFPEYFDTIIVDAPCSGEGMFRKNPQTKLEWSLEHVLSCAKRQYEILCSADRALARGGHLVYSTCTYNIFENEQVIEKFLSAHDYSIVKIDKSLLNTASPGLAPITDAMRIYPHTSDGEGHFICLLKKNSGDTNNDSYSLPYLPCSDTDIKAATQQIYEHFAVVPNGCLRFFNEKIYDIPFNMPYSKKLRVIKSGITVAEKIKNRIIPHHNFSTCFNTPCTENSISFRSDSVEIAAYLHGETIQANAHINGFGILCVDGYPLSIVKYSDNTIKNHYPKGLRNFKR